MTLINHELAKHINHTGFNDIYIIWHFEVMGAIDKLKPNKGDHYNDLSMNNFEHACSELYVHIAHLSSSILIHFVIPDDFSLNIITATPKGKNANISNSNNYHSNTLGSVFGKLFNNIAFN